MKKSERYTIAMEAVLDAEYENAIKLEVLETLMGDRSTALFVEKQEVLQDAKAKEVQA